MRGDIGERLVRGHLNSDDSSKRKKQNKNNPSVLCDHPWIELEDPGATADCEIALLSIEQAMPKVKAPQLDCCLLHYLAGRTANLVRPSVDGVGLAGRVVQPQLWKGRTHSETLRARKR